MAVLVWILFPTNLWARNITQYKDTISNSAPLTESNHSLSFKLDTTIAPGSYLEVTMPDGFETIGTTTFSADRNVELSVNNVLRQSSSTQSATYDQVEIFPGSPGVIRYTLNTTDGITTGSLLNLKIGNNTSKSLTYSLEFSTSTGTTTTQADIKPITNASTIGTHKVGLKIYDGGEVADANFSIALVEQVGVGPADTTEDIPPERFNGAPTSTISGTSLNVEIFVETNELAVCKYALDPDIDYASMPFQFTNTGLIYHTKVVPVVPDSLQTFYVRCIDDEGNFNTDDYLIQFFVNATPTGNANEEGDVEGDGSGTGNNGTGDGGGSGGTTGQSNGEAPTTGGTSGEGGSGGGGGGGSGGSSGNTAGGGFESTDGPYRSGDGRVIVSGVTSPRSEVFVLVDGKVAIQRSADSRGVYSITVDAIARGVYTFGVYSIDPAKNKSSTFSTSFTVTGARASALSNINIAPTIRVSPDPVDPGQVLTLNGYALANSVVTLENIKDGSTASKKEVTVNADGNGAWSTTLDTSGFTLGTYKVRAKASQADGITTNFSNYTLYGVGQSAVRPINADLNRDGKVNLVDFSILLFWWNTNGGTSDPSADINGDSKVNLVDFSILLFNWTG